MTDTPDNAGATSGGDDDETLLAAFVGPNWAPYYQRAFAERAAGRSTFNKAAMLAPLWFAWRGMWLLQLGAGLSYLLIIAALATVLPVETNAGAVVAYGVGYLLLGVIEGVGADALLRQRAAKAVKRVRTLGLKDDPALVYLRRRGGVSVVGVVVIPVLMFLVSNQFIQNMGHSHDKVYTSLLKSELRNLVTAQEAYFSDHAAFAQGLQEMYYTTSTGVTVTPGPASATGWSATATSQSSNQVCGIVHGTGTPPMRGLEADVPRCEKGTGTEAHSH